MRRTPPRYGRTPRFHSFASSDRLPNSGSSFSFEGQGFADRVRPIVFDAVPDGLQPVDETLKRFDRSRPLLRFAESASHVGNRPADCRIGLPEHSSGRAVGSFPVVPLRPLQFVFRIVRSLESGGGRSDDGERGKGEELDEYAFHGPCRRINRFVFPSASRNAEDFAAADMDPVSVSIKRAA